MPVINAKTGEVAIFESDDDLNTGISSGTFVFKDEPMVHVYRVGHPSDISLMPVGNIMDAHSLGYAIESPIKRELREYAEINSDILGIAKTAAGEFANSLLLTVPEIVMQNNDDPMVWAKALALRQENTVGALGGDVAGTIASMFLNPLGPVGTVAGKVGSRAGIKLLAKRIQSSVGKGLSDKLALKSASEMLANIGKKTGGNIIGRGALGLGKGVARGMDEALPVAAAHSYFGDYTKAGESLAMNALFGGVLQLPGGAVRGLGALKGVSGKKFEKFVGEKQPGETTGQKALVKLWSSITTLSDNDVRYALRNGAAVNNSKDFGILFNEIGGLRQDILQNQIAKKNLMDTAGKDLKGLKTIRTAETKAMAQGPNEKLAERIESDLVEMREYYKFRSAQADDSLAEMIPDSIISRQGLIDSFNRELKNFEGRSGAENALIARQLRVIGNTLGKVPQMMNGLQARRVLSDLRKDVDFEQFGKASADFQESIASITEDFSTQLKATPGAARYSEIMDIMSSRMDDTNAFEKAMKSRTARLGAASTLSKPLQDMKPIDLSKKEVMDKFMFAMDDVNPLARSEYKVLSTAQKEGNEYLSDLKKMKDDDFDSKYFTERFEDYTRKVDQSQEADFSVNTMRPLIGTNPNIPMSESTLKKFSDENTDVALNDAFEAFGEATNNPNIRDELRASVVSDNINNSKVGNARMINLGGFTGGWAFAWLGALADVGSGPLLKYISKQPMIKSMFNAENKMAKVANAVDDMPNRGWFAKGKAGAAASMKYSKNAAMKSAASATNSVLNDTSPEEKEALGITTRKATENNVTDREFSLGIWKTLHSQYTAMEENPQLLVDRLEIATEEMAQGSPELAEAMGGQIAQAINYLSNEMPRSSVPDSPYVEKGQEWEPSDLDLDIFQQKVVAIQEPLTVIDSLYAGEATRDMVNALAAVYPSILEMIQTKLAETMAENPDALDYSRRLQAGYLLDMVIDPSASPKSLMYYQGTFAPAPEERGPGGPSGGGGGKPFAPKLNPKSSAAVMTTSTRLSNDIYN